MSKVKDILIDITPDIEIVREEGKAKTKEEIIDAVAKIRPDIDKYFIEGAYELEFENNNSEPPY
jgi:hypothetical protein|tara:strand:+ start:2457 stop:2648 length:192 start_codon:yes stop_codon:yes gene_type:complete